MNMSVRLYTVSEVWADTAEVFKTQNAISAVRVYNVHARRYDRPELTVKDIETARYGISWTGKYIGVDVELHISFEG